MEADIHLKSYWAVVKRRKLYFIMPCIVLFAAITTIVLLIPLTYKATATITIESDAVSQNLVHSTASGYIEQRLSAIRKRALSYRDAVKAYPGRERIEVYEIPYNFSPAASAVMDLFWKKRQAKKYGFGSLLGFLFRAPARPLFRFYYRKAGRPFPDWTQLDGEVCSEAVDKCLKAGGFDAFPEYGEHTTYPGLFASKFKRVTA